MPSKNQHTADKSHRHENPELAEAMRGFRSSNAAQPHVPTPDKGTRTERDRKAIRDQLRGGDEG